MISRRRILSRSRDELHAQQGLGPNGYPDNYNPYEEEEDVWYSRDKLFKDHILEILNKWDQIDDEIWAKLIVMERNRRVAKAYARAPILTMNGTEDGFDGYRIGLNGFDNPMRDPKTEAVKQLIGEGVKIRMDEDGNVLVKRISKSNVYVKGWTAADKDDSSVSNDIIRQNGALDYGKAAKLFDMKKFQSNMARELRRQYPDRRKLENQCICCIGFVKDSPEMLDMPIWVMVINIVAMDMLKSKLPLGLSKRQSVPNLAMYDRQKSMEEDPYSLPGNNSGGSSSGGSRSSGHYGKTLPTNGQSGDSKPPKLPPRDFERQKQALLAAATMKPDSKSKKSKKLSKFEHENPYGVTSPPTGIDRNPRLFDDPYYSGFSARVPNYAKRSQAHPTSGQMQPSYGPLYGDLPPAPIYSGKNPYSEYAGRKVPSSGFLNSFLKNSSNVTHGRTATYQSYYGSVGESDPYTASSESMPGDESLHYGDSIYGRIPPPKSTLKSSGAQLSSGGYPPLSRSQQKQQQQQQAQHHQQTIPWAYRSAMSNDRSYYGGWDD